MKNIFSRIPVFYFLFTLILLGALGFGQVRGLPLLNVFTGSLHSPSTHDGPDHK